VSLVNVRFILPMDQTLTSDAQNWKAEFQKWLGRDRVGILVCDKKGNIDLFAAS